LNASQSVLVHVIQEKLAAAFQGAHYRIASGNASKQQA
jgi:hypothetical protein